MNNAIELCRAATALAAPGGPVEAEKLNTHQFALHAYAWMATYVTALEQLLAWAERLEGESRLSDLERAILGCSFGAYLKQLKYGIAMSQDEIARPGDLGLDESAYFTSDAASTLMTEGDGIAARQVIAAILGEGSGDFGDRGLDETHGMIADQFRRFSDEKVSPHAHGWHVRDELIPLEIIHEMAELGVFGLTIPEEDGGLGLDKIAMCVVTEELARGYIGVGSLGTRLEVAAELIRVNGTPEQKAKYLGPIAAGKILPTAVFTEPNHGSDLAQYPHPRNARWRCLSGQGQQDLDHPRRAHGHDDLDGAHRHGRGRLSRALDVPGRENHAAPRTTLSPPPAWTVRKSGCSAIAA